MNLNFFAGLSWLLALLLFSGPASLAQEQESGDEEQLETITLPEKYDRSEEEFADDEFADDEFAEEAFDDMVFDEETGSYRLIEDDEGDDWIEGPSERESLADELQRMFSLYREALGNKQYLEADTLAKQVVELSIRLNGLDSMDSARAISNLGIAQHHNKDYESALRNFSASIDIIERIDNRLSAALINPLKGLAASQAATGRPDLAKGSYQRAVHVSHVNSGPHNKNQIETLESMAELHVSLGDYDDATDVQRSIFAIQSRGIELKSLDILPALERRAKWEHRLQRYDRERATWRQVINIMEKHYGKKSLLLIAPLTNLGKSYLFVSPAEFDYQPEVSSSSGETYLRRAVRIAEENPDSDWQIQEKTLLALGDYYILGGRPNRAARTYAEAWTMLTDEENQQQLRHRRDNLENVTLLQKVFPPKYYNSVREDSGQPPPDSFETGQMSFSYTVSPTGIIEDLVHVETQPREIEDFSQTVGRNLRRQMYRPRLQDGKLVATAEIIYTHDFFYRPSDLPEPSEEAESEAESE
jgi:tetratricopeptide (TPR) repeat protein